MDPLHDLAPLFVEHGTVAHPRDMVRALETIEGFNYTYSVDGTVMAEGKATLVKLMADLDSATMLVNGCLFLNVASFRYLNFHTAENGCSFELMGEGCVLTMSPAEVGDTRFERRRDMRLLEEEAFDPGSFVALDEEDDDEF